MKYLSLPTHLVEFWYAEGLEFFIRTWKNLMLLLEEDLAVNLMWRLLFTPLFHDSTIIGHVLSFLFRIFRIMLGLTAFLMASIVMLVIASYWFFLPALAVFDISPSINLPPFVLTSISRVLIFSGIGLFLLHVTTHPHRKVWQVSKNDLWSASTVKKEDISLKNLIKNSQVIDLLSNLELQLESVPHFEFKNIEDLSIKAYELAKASKSDYIGPRHFFVAMLWEIPRIEDMLLKLDLKPEDFIEALNYLEKKNQIWRKIYIWDDDFVIHHLKGVNRGWLGVPTPALDLYSHDLTREAATRGFSDMIREQSIITEVVNILSQQTGRNVILVGSPGSGKSTLVKHLAKQIVTGDAPPALATKRLVNLDLTSLLSAVKTQGELAERIKNIFDEVAFAQNVIIVIEEIHELGTGEVGSSFNLYSLMEPYLEKDSFQFIGTTENQNYTKILEKNSSFARLFRKIELSQATFNDSLNILEERSIEYQRKNKVKVSFIALKASVELSQKFIKDRVLPDSAISVLKESMTQSVNNWITKDVVRRVVSNRVKVPLMEIGNVDKNRLLNLESELHNRLIGQDQAVKAVSNSLRRASTGLAEEGRPIGSFLFVGPTGVGKTELAKTLADVYFGVASHPSKSLNTVRDSSGAFVRFDMSEYQNEESIVRLIGGPGEGGQLTEAVRSRPYGLILLDEFEKAHEKILTLFLQVLDDGILTDGAGRTVSFENTIIIATSNAGSLIIAELLQQGKDMETIDRKVNEELLKTFKPELINRFDDIIIFKPLTQIELEKIVKLKLKILQDSLRQKGYLAEFDENLVAELAKKGFDTVLGARPLRRLIQDTLESNLSKMILQNKLQKGVTFEVKSDMLIG